MTPNWPRGGDGTARGSGRRAVVVLGHGERVRLASAAATAWLAEHFAPTPPGRLPATVEAWVRETRAREASGAGSQRGLVSERDASRLRVRFVPAADAGEVDGLLLELEAAVPAATAVAGLTTREAEVLELAAAGLTNKEIATELEVSPRTVQKHLEHVYEKLGVTGRIAAVTKAIDAARAA